jgi:hypothetical protein
VVSSGTASVPTAALPAACRSNFQVVDVTLPSKGSTAGIPASVLPAGADAPADAPAAAAAAAAAPAPAPAASADAPAATDAAASTSAPADTPEYTRARLQLPVTTTFTYSAPVVSLYVNGVMVSARSAPCEMSLSTATRLIFATAMNDLLDEEELVPKIACAGRF